MFLKVNALKDLIRSKKWNTKKGSFFKKNELKGKIWPIYLPPVMSWALDIKREKNQPFFWIRQENRATWQERFLEGFEKVTAITGRQIEKARLCLTFNARVY